MIIQATPYGTKKEEPFAFTYSGDFTDERVDGIGDVTLNTSGQLVTTGQTVTVSVYILAGGGGAAIADRMSSGSSNYAAASGGGGGNQTLEVELTPGTYEIVIGTGGEGRKEYKSSGSITVTGGDGGDTSAFGIISTGGSGGVGQATGTSTSARTYVPGAGGLPNGGTGTGGLKISTSTEYAGGSPNGGSIVGATVNNGGDGYVRITFS